VTTYITKRYTFFWGSPLLRTS